VFLLCFWIGFAIPPSGAAEVSITGCGTIVPPGDIATLAGDLVCTSSTPVAVTLGNNATLNLNGFTLSGPYPADSAWGATCDEKCTINGPGSIAGFGFGVHSSSGGVIVTGVTLANNSSAISAGTVTVEDTDFVSNFIGIQLDFGRISSSNFTGNSYGIRGGQVTIDGTSFVDNESIAVDVGFNSNTGTSPYSGMAVLDGCSITGSDLAIDGDYTGGRVRVEASTISPNEDGIVGELVRVYSSDLIGGTGRGIQAYRTIVKGSSLTDFDLSAIDAWIITGPYPERRTNAVTLVDSTVSGNGHNGVRSNGRLKAKRTPITGNGLAMDCDGPSTCADVFAVQKPRLKDSPCDTSWGVFATDWDVCALDPM
jgi:hypothetical protein